MKKSRKVLICDEDGHFNYIDDPNLINNFKKQDKVINHILYIFYIIVFIGIIGFLLFYYSEKQFFYLKDNELNMLIDSEYKIELLGRISQKEAKDFNFKSSDPNIVSVNEFGEVRALNNGNASITVEPKEGLFSTSRSIEINVDDSLIYDIEFDNDNIILEEGEYYKPKLNINEKNIYNINITWESSNNNIARVDKKGEIRALNKGECIITAYIDDSNISTKLKVNVVDKGDKNNKDIVLAGSDEQVDDINDVIAVQSVNLTAKKDKIYIGESIKIEYLIEPNNATNKKVFFSSNNTKVLTVNSSGIVTGVGIGKANVEVKTEYGNKTAFIPIEVVDRPDSVSFVELNKNNVNLSLGESEVLTYTINPKDAKKRVVSWKSSNTNAVKVDNKGRLTAVGIGSSTVTLTVDGKKDTCFVKVGSLDIESITLDRSSIELNVGESTILNYSVIPERFGDSIVSWSSSNNKIAKVDSSGKVTGVKEGNAVITIRSTNGVSSSAKVTVKRVPVSSVKFNKTNTSLYISGKENLSYTIYPFDATNKNVRFKSSNPSIVSVDSDGKINGIKEGNAVITIETVDGNIKDSIDVSVYKNNVEVKGITFLKSSTTLYVGESELLIAIVRPSYATNQNISYKSSNPEVVSVESNGRIIAHKEGEANISAISFDGGYTAEAKVKVIEVPVDKISISKNEENIPLGSSLQLLTNIEPKNASSKLHWSSNNAAVATVDDTGKVSTHSVGTATITVKTNNNKEAKCHITVFTVKVKSISFDSEEINLYIGSSEIINPIIKPNNASNKNMSYLSSDSKIVNVNSSGKMTGISEGSTTIKVKSVDGSDKTSFIKVNVVPVPISKITLNKSTIILYKNNTFKVETSITPDNASNKKLVYSSNNSNIATVDDNGLVTAKEFGTAIINIDSTDNSQKKAYLKVVVVPNDKIIDIRNSTYRKYHTNIGTYEGTNYKHMQNFAITNLGKNNEMIYFSTASAGSYSSVIYPKLSGAKRADLNRTIIYRTSKANINNPSKRQKMYLKNTGHGQAFEIEGNTSFIWVNAGGKTPTVINNTWWGGSTKVMLINFATVSKNANYKPIRTYSLSANGNNYGYGEPSIDLTNNLIAFRSGSRVFVYDYKKLKNGVQELLYSFKINSSKIPKYSNNKSPYYQGSSIKGGYFYVYRGDTGKDAYIEAFNMLGEPIYYKKLTTIGYPTPGINSREPEGLHIYNNTLFVGSAHFDGSGKSVFDIGYFK